MARDPRPFDKYYLIVDKGYKTPCWIWQYATSERGDYGSYKTNQKTVRAHRYSYERTKGKIPEGKELDHLCKNGLCVNPEHLEPVSRKINNSRKRNIVLSYDLADQIRAESLAGASQNTLAKKYKIDQARVSRIVNNLIWVRE